MMAASSNSCCFHVVLDQKGPISPLTIALLLNVLINGLHLDGILVKVAKGLVGKLEANEGTGVYVFAAAVNNGEAVGNFASASWACLQCMLDRGYAWFHQLCYKRFTDKSGIGRSEKRDQNA